MDFDASKIIADAARDGLREAIKTKLSSPYSDNPLQKIVAQAIEKQAATFLPLLADSITACLGDQQFREEIAAHVRSQLAKMLVAKFGGEMEKQVNALKSDPATRARITAAIDQVVKEKLAAP